MNDNVKEYVIQKVKEMIDAPSCSTEAKTAGNNWINSLGTENEAQETKKLIKELEQDIMPIDMLIDFTASDAGVKLFGKEMAENINQHAKEIKNGGAIYCDCPACAAAAAVLEKKDELIKV